MTRRLGVSNLAWTAADDERMPAFLTKHDIQGIEVAPTRIAPWSDITPHRLAEFVANCSRSGVSVSSLQAIFYGKPELSLLGNEAGFIAMTEHMKVVADIARSLGAGIAVFGAPRNRLKGALSLDAAMHLAAERFTILGDIVREKGLVLGIEPVPEIYGADFLTHAQDVIDLVRMTGHGHVRVHLDTACVAMAGDDPGQAILEAGSLLAHYHVAEPDLGGFTPATLDHARAGKALDEIGYEGWVVIEMKAGKPLPDAENVDQHILSAIGTARDCYFPSIV
ncbi:sugar phosphate isomerase/epimerase family protein [Acetobacter fallax]|uniref:TIM barrel protein n=1 Tax=Acetobacter fallax TaxID=1737473 RepID=A0ABX0KKF5_9PROT|nr:sugar phosphate isomerase/epimerase family protein [Acetobacter fallax]NHO34352.1 TIM barrel protein [Acetobacter fallax]NHO37921.1 TIM barrel protein [Acetobacter fallax]